MSTVGQEFAARRLERRRKLGAASPRPPRREGTESLGSILQRVFEEAAEDPRSLAALLPEEDDLR